MEFIVWRDSILLGSTGLPAAVWRYERGLVDEREVARRFIRARVEKPEQFTAAEDEVEELALLIARYAEPALAHGSLKELADSLVELQHRRIVNAEKTRAKATDKMLGGAQAMRDFGLWLAEIPGLGDMLLAQQIQQSGLSSAQYKAQLRQAHERRRMVTDELREKVRRHGDQVRGELERQKQQHPRRLTLQEQLMAPAEAVRGLGQLLRTLEERGIIVPESIARIEREEELTEDELRSAAGDAAAIAREQGDEEAAEVAEFVADYRGEDFLDKLNELVKTLWAKAGASIAKELVFAVIATWLVTHVVFPEEKAVVNIEDVDIHLGDQRPEFHFHLEDEGDEPGSSRKKGEPGDEPSPSREKEDDTPPHEDEPPPDAELPPGWSHD